MLRGLVLVLVLVLMRRGLIWFVQIAHLPQLKAATMPFRLATHVESASDDTSKRQSSNHAFPVATHVESASDDTSERHPLQAHLGHLQTIGLKMVSP